MRMRRNLGLVLGVIVTAGTTGCATTVGDPVTGTQEPGASDDAGSSAEAGKADAAAVGPEDATAAAADVSQPPAPGLDSEKIKRI